MADHNKNLIEELERRLCWYRDEATGEEFDVEEVDAICTMLQKLSPEEEPHRSKEEVYRNIMELVREEERDSCDRDAGDDRKKRIPFRKRGCRAAVIFIAVFGAALLSLNMVTYARGDKSLFRMILERVGVVEIVKEDNEDDIAFSDNKLIENFYDSWAELDNEIKSKIVVPGYIPDRYSLYGIKYWNFNNRKNIQADYYNEENKHILIEITLLESEAKEYREIKKVEDIYELLPEYSNEDTLYYQYEDEYVCMAFIGNNFYRINGTITIEEMIKIREGLEITNR